MRKITFFLFAVGIFAALFARGITALEPPMTAAGSLGLLLVLILAVADWSDRLTRRMAEDLEDTERLRKTIKRKPRRIPSKRPARPQHYPRYE
jgi:hypothetical protein